MKLRLLSLLCVPLLFTGCLGEGPWVTYHYVYRNMTDRPVEVVAYSIYDNHAVEIMHSFSILPGGEHTLSGQHYGVGYYFPFECNHIKLSDGEQTVILTKKDKPSDEWHCLFKQDCYQKQPSKKRNVAWYTYVFTEADFATDVPVNND